MSTIYSYKSLPKDRKNEYNKSIKGESIKRRSIKGEFIKGKSLFKPKTESIESVSKIFLYQQFLFKKNLLNYYLHFLKIPYHNCVKKSSPFALTWKNYKLEQMQTYQLELTHYPIILHNLKHFLLKCLAKKQLPLISKEDLIHLLHPSSISKIQTIPYSDMNSFLLKLNQISTLTSSLPPEILCVFKYFYISNWNVITAFYPSLFEFPHICMSKESFTFSLSNYFESYLSKNQLQLKMICISQNKSQFYSKMALVFPYIYGYFSVLLLKNMDDIPYHTIIQYYMIDRKYINDTININDKNQKKSFILQ